MKNKFVNYCIFLCVIALWGCSKDEPTEVKELAILLSKQKAEVGEAVHFQLENSSANQRVTWHFGDSQTSTQNQDTHRYSSPDHYEISAEILLENGELKVLKSEIEVYLPEVTERISIAASLKMKDHIQICAHRGYWKDAPENSTKAVELAIEHDIDMIELDVRTSKDGQMILMHDATIDRTTNGTGRVQDKNYKELLTYHLYHGQNLTSERIPLLKEALLKARGKIYIDFDVKNSDYKKLYELVKLCGMLSQVMFTVYDVTGAKQILAIDKEIMLLPVVYEMADLDNYLIVAPSLRVVQFNTSAFTQEILEKAYKKGISAFKNIYINSDVTPTSDRYRQVKQFVDMKGSIIQTDYPVELREYLNNN